MSENSSNTTNEKDYGEIFKKCTECFFERVNKEFALRENPVQFEEIQFKDGYYIFDFGTNAVINFHIKECPGWLFGIWWGRPKDTESQKKIKGQLFAQYEETIDKFKPSYSTFCTTILVDPDESNTFFEYYSAADMIAFIKNEPYLAFCRDYCDWDYNSEYHTIEEAEAEFNEYKTWNANKIKYTKELDEKVIAFVKDNILPLYNDAEIRDQGKNWHPRYEVIAPLEKNKDVVDEDGWYNWLDRDNEEEAKIMQDYDTLVKECEKTANKYDFLWFDPFNPSVGFYKVEVVDQ